MMTPEFLDPLGKPIEGSVAEILTLPLGGVTQTVILRGVSVDNPVLLFLHGGPGTPEFNLLRRSCPKIEEVFTIAHWEQRGAGLSFSDEVTAESMTTHQLVEDASELASYLSQRFGQPKIYVMGHSWGTNLGIQLVHKYPGHFLAYIGMGQIASYLRSEQVGYDWLISRLEEEGDQENLLMFSAQPRPDETIRTTEDWMAYLNIHRPLCQKYGGGASHYEDWDHEMMQKLYDETPEYGENGCTTTLLPGLNFTLQNLMGEFVFIDLFKEFTEFEIPIYMLNGIHDYQTTHQVAYEYFEQIKAPKKQFFSFEKSAHTPFYDEPERFIEVIQQILDDRT